MAFFAKNRGAAVIEKVKVLQGLTCKRSLDQLYAYLTILDSKATGLLTVNTVFIAILLVFFDKGDEIANQWQIPHPKGLLKLQLLLLCVSALLCLLVVRVSWEFLAKVPTAPANESDFDRELARLANVIFDRTR